jgi:hypothetical protein
MTMNIRIWHATRGSYVYIQTRECIWIVQWPRLVRFHKGWDHAIPLTENAYETLHVYEDEMDFETISWRRQKQCCFAASYEPQEDDVLICYEMREYEAATYDARGVWMRDIKILRPTLSLWDGDVLYYLDYKRIRAKRGRGFIVLDGTWFDLLKRDISVRQEKSRWSTRRRRAMRADLKKPGMTRQTRVQNAIEEAAAMDDGYVPDLSPDALRRKK